MRYRKLSLFSALMLLVGWQERRPACTKTCCSKHNGFFLGDLAVADPGGNPATPQSGHGPHPIVEQMCNYKNTTTQKHN